MHGFLARGRCDGERRPWRVAGCVALTAVVAFGGAATIPANAQTDDFGFAGGTVREINPSGAWSWFEGPRAIHTDCELLVGSVSSSGMIEVSSAVLGSASTRIDQIGGPVESDDHNSPGLLELPDGKIASSWARHHKDSTVHNAERPASMWNWFDTTPITASIVTYANLAHLADEGRDGRLYNFFRGNTWQSIFSVSDDHGRSWSTPAPLLRKYGHRPYVVFDDDGSSRIDLATTEGHPRDYADGGVYHGFIQGNRIRRSDGRVVATTDFGIAPEELTLVHRPGQDQRAWTLDIAAPTASSPTTIVFSVRDLATGTPTHLRNRYHYATWDGAAWLSYPLAWAGDSLYQAEQFYTGGVAIDPADPSHVVLSTNVDPSTGLPWPPAPGRSVAAHQLFDGFTSDGGQTWQFQPITMTPEESNIRPVIPEPGASARSLLWMRGTYSSWLSYDTAVLAIVEGGPASECQAPLDSRGPTSFPGDFDGDGLVDWFDYRPGSAPETVSWGDGDRTSHSVSGTYEPQVHRAANGKDQIIWASPSASYVWRENGHRFSSRGVVHASGVELVSGDFDGDGVDDLFHYRPGTARDRIYWSDGTSTPLYVNGDYEPLAGDFTGDGIDDLLWYAPGAAADYYWRFTAEHSWSSSGARVGGSYTPAIGDIDQDGTDDIFWRRDGGGGYHWLHQAGQVPRVVSVPVR